MPRPYAKTDDPLQDAADRGRSHGQALHDLLTSEELEFGRAMDRYKRRYRRPYPAWHEVLAVLKSLGYRNSTETPT